MTTDRRDGDRGPSDTDRDPAERAAGDPCTFDALFERAPPTVGIDAVRSALATVRSGDRE